MSAFSPFPNTCALLTLVICAVDGWFRFRSFRSGYPWLPCGSASSICRHHLFKKPSNFECRFRSWHPRHQWLLRSRLHTQSLVPSNLERFI
ncbi:hypothetical protein BKA70DRAFT_824586 [Coprinopsis sp. MPI-PUGE-AT-0042]|nr:hypothetical protein BKA70DRAFT_824586 [Coprinopsis sp. MPI-PUGE-AT-0042]